jgi:hypothetical protein
MVEAMAGCCIPEVDIATVIGIAPGEAAAASMTFVGSLPLAESSR